MLTPPTAEIPGRLRCETLGLQLIHRARTGILIGPPPDKARAVADSVVGHAVESDFDDELRVERFPFFGAARAPAAGPARRLARKAGAFDKFLELGHQFE